MSEKSASAEEFVRTVVVKTPVQENTLDKSLPVYCKLHNKTYKNYASWVTHRSKFHRGEKLDIDHQELKVVATTKNSEDEDDDDDESNDFNNITIEEHFSRETAKKHNKEPAKKDEVSVKPAEKIVDGDQLTPRELALQHISEACKLLMQPHSTVSGLQEFVAGDAVLDYVADQIVFASLTEFIPDVACAMNEITNDSQLNYAYVLLERFREIEEKRRIYDSQARWQKSTNASGRLLAKIGMFHGKKHLDQVDEKTRKRRVTFNIEPSPVETDNSQQSKKQKQ